MIDVELTVLCSAADRYIAAARRRVASLDRYVDRPLIGARLVLRDAGRRSGRPYRADASVLFAGRLLAAHGTGPTPAEAAGAAVVQLRQQIRGIVGAQVALRNDPRVLEGARQDTSPDHPLQLGARRKPPGERRIIPRRPHVSVALSTFDAIDDMLSLEVLFYLFRHVRTDEGVVVHHRDDGRIGMLFPPGSVLIDEADLIAARPSRYDHPRTLTEVRDEMDMANHRFVYFVQADDGRGKVMYLRNDGDYGLVQFA